MGKPENTMGKPENTEIFLKFNIQGQQKQQRELFQVLENEISHNPDIQSLGVEIFGSENAFFEWYLSPNNRGNKNGIPDGISKIDVLCKLQQFDKKTFSRLKDASARDTEYTYKLLISYAPTTNRFDRENNTIPLFFSDEVLEQYITDWEAGWRG